FPPLDRIDYLDHAVVLTERERVRPAQPALDEIHRYLAGAPFANWSDAAGRVATAAMLMPPERQADPRALLYPGPVWDSVRTGRMGSNGEAVAFLDKARPVGLDVSLIARALRCRQADVDPDPLFFARTTLPSQVEACAALLAE